MGTYGRKVSSREVIHPRRRRSSWTDGVKWRSAFRTFVILGEGLQYLPALGAVEGLQDQGDGLRHYDWQARHPPYSKLG